MATTTIIRCTCWCTVVLIMTTGICCAVLNTKPVSHTDMRIRVQNFMCGKPRPRSFRITELFNNVSEYAVYPSRIVLNRCEDALGCCNAGQECTMKTSMSIELNGYFDVSIGRPLALKTEEHTSCHCIPREEQIK